MSDSIITKLNAWSKWVRKMFRKRKVIAGKNIRVQQTEAGAIISVAGNVGGGGGNTVYNGPFRVLKYSDTEIRIPQYHAMNNPIHNYINAGIERFEKTTDTIATMTQSGFIYAKITYTSSYQISYFFGTTVPIQADGEYYVPLAWFDFSNSKIQSITQIQYGEIFVSGRIV